MERMGRDGIGERDKIRENKEEYETYLTDRSLVTVRIRRLHMRCGTMSVLLLSHA
jgi:hypothetical protein